MLVQAFLHLRAVNRKQLLAQKISKEAVQLIRAIFQAANQREFTIAELTDEMGELAVLKNFGPSCFVGGAEERSLPKECLFLWRSRRVKFFGQRIKRFAASRILAIDIGEPFAERRS